MQTVVQSQVVAAILRLFPAAAKPSVQTLSSPQLPELMAIVRLVKRIPSELFQVQIEQYIEVECAIEVVEHSLRLLNREQYQFQIVTVGDTNKSVVQVIYQVLKACPDHFPASSAVNLTFIADVKTRDSISMEIGSVESAIRNGEWKAGTVLAGATIEALLLWRLRQFTDQERADAVGRCRNVGALKHRPKPNLCEWTLAELIEASAELGFLRPNTATEARQSKDFRNLIHPGRVLASDAECNRGTALPAVAALDFVVADLSARP